MTRKQVQRKRFPPKPPFQKERSSFIYPYSEVDCFKRVLWKDNKYNYYFYKLNSMFEKSLVTFVTSLSKHTIRHTKLWLSFLSKIFLLKQSTAPAEFYGFQAVSAKTRPIRTLTRRPPAYGLRGLASVRSSPSHRGR